MHKVVVILIIVMSFALRFYGLGDYPALNADEAAIGYNAYSLLETGRDEHGNIWPIHFQSFNDYKPGLFFYLVIPFVKLIGLNEWAVRIPGATAGVLGVLVIYLLVKELFKDEKHALAAALVLAVNPWHIHFSRGGWEVNVATLFISAGVWSFLKGKRDKKYFPMSVFLFAASLYTYHAARVVVPILGLGLVFYCRDEIRKAAAGTVIGAVLLGLALTVPLAVDLSKGEVASRASGVGLFADTGPISRVNEQRGEHDNFGGAVAITLHNKVANYSLAFVSNWIGHFNGEFLFLSGDEIQRNRVPETGQLHMVDFIFMAIALFGLVKSRRREWGLVGFWLLVAPMASALTFQSPHALRAHNMVVPLAIVVSYGLTLVFVRIRKIEQRRLRVVWVLMLVGVGTWSLVRYQRMYWLHMAKEYPFSSQYGVKELVSYIEREGNKYERIIVTDKYDQPYILFLFYSRYPPELFQKEHVLSERDKYGFSTVREFDKYRFRGINYDEDVPENPGSLIAGSDEEINDAGNVVGEIYGSNGYKYFQVVAN